MAADTQAWTVAPTIDEREVLMSHLESRGRDGRIDVQNDADIREIVDTFYAGINEDPVIGRYFANLNMEDHLPTMYGFWSSIVFQTGTYRGRPLDAHLGLEGLDSVHFSRWLNRFEATIDARFVGEHAERMKERAHQIGAIFQLKLGLHPRETS